ncbi:MAG TPA: universal stress protein, partial [Steroidobacteraceae bacterium]|nr:universal stress protein [Steroidobacteraceae bacterium]
MKQVRNILVVVDPSAATQPAVTKAMQLAQLLKARVELFVCDYRAGLEVPSAAGARANLLEHRRAMLEEIAAPHRKLGIEVTVDAAFDNPLHEGLLRKIAKSHADLVVKDTHYHNLMRRTLITNTDWHLIRSCPLPLLLVKPTHWSPQLRTLAAIDPGHMADKPAALDHEICEWSATLAATMRGETHAVHMYFPSALLITSAAATGMPMTVATGQEQQLIEDERRERMKMVREITTPYGIPPDRIHLMLGSAVDLLAEAAERVRADIVVMGAVSRSRLQRIFIG